MKTRIQRSDDDCYSEGMLKLVEIGAQARPNYSWCSGGPSSNATAMCINGTPKVHKRFCDSGKRSLSDRLASNFSVFLTFRR